MTIRQLYPETLVCPTCQRPYPLEADQYRPLTSRELDVLSAWWRTRSVKQAAVVIGVSEQRAKNLLARARSRGGVHTNAELAGQYQALLRPASHNTHRREAK